MEVLFLLVMLLYNAVILSNNKILCFVMLVLKTVHKNTF